MRHTFRLFLLACLLLGLMVPSYANGSFNDPKLIYGVPTLSLSPKGQVAMSWTEKDAAGIVSFYWAPSTDQGKTFAEKRLIFASAGLNAGRLMRPKLLFKKDGTLVAVFGLRGDALPAAASTANAGHDAHAGHGDAHAGHGAAPAAKPAAAPQGGRPRDQHIVFATSKDGGKTWSAPVPVHADRTAGVMRGFFDATVLANDEIAVAYLKDIPGKAHARDLRMVISSGSQFGEERVIDPFVCDCCPVSLLVDGKGAFHLFYRANNDNIRDMATKVSTDNGKTFTNPRTLFADNWKINGCPHSGPTSVATANGPLVAWFSGPEGSRGIRMVNAAGQRPFVIDENTAKNAWLTPGATPVLVWEQMGGSEAEPFSTVAYKVIKGNGTPETKFIPTAKNAVNVTGVVVGNQLVVAYEVAKPGSPAAMEWVSVAL